MNEWDDILRLAVAMWLERQNESINALAHYSGVSQPIIQRWYKYREPNPKKAKRTATLRVSDASKIGRVVGAEIRILGKTVK